MTVEPAGKTTYFPFPGYSEEMVGTSVTARRITYTIAGQAVASRVQTFSPASNTLYRLYTDHLGSTVTQSTLSGGAVGGTNTYYLPYGSYRGTPPTQTLTDRDFTGQRENRELGLLYYQARFYVPSIGRFASADTIVPDPANPQQFNRYTYSLNSPLNYSDPTGHRTCSSQQATSGDETCNQNAKDSTASQINAGCIEVWCKDTVEGFASNCSGCAEYDFATYGDVLSAYQVYQQIGSLNREDLFAILIAAEFGIINQGTEAFGLLQEALARQFYHFCPGGSCTGDQLWLFLGGLQGWFQGDAIDHYRSGSYENYLGKAQEILSNSRWRSGMVGDRPWTWGNKNQMFSSDELEKAGKNYAFTVQYSDNMSISYQLGYIGVTSGINPVYILTRAQQVARSAYRNCHKNPCTPNG